MGLEVLSVAIDALGTKMVMPYIEAANCTFPTLVDDQNHLSELFGFKAVPNVIVINQRGIIVGKQFGKFDIRKPDDLDMVHHWIDPRNPIGEVGLNDNGASMESHSDAIKLFQRGMQNVADNRIDEALNLWRFAVEKDPSNYVIRKQIWAIENPEKFYDGEVDFDWQNAKLREGD